MECPAECAGPVLAHLSLLRPESEETSWKHAQHHRRWAADRSRAFRRAWDLGSRALGEGPFSQEASQNGFKIASKWLGSWRHLGASLEPSWSILGCWDPLGRLLEGSWRPLGAKKSSCEPPRAVLRRPKGLVSAILEAKRLPKWSPGGSQIEVQKRSELKIAKP